MASTTIEQQIIATLMSHPKLLLQSDKYQLSENDFDNISLRYMFWAISNLAPGATKSLTPFEVEAYLQSSPSARAALENKGSRQFIIDCSETSVSNFDAMYMQLKKENLMKDLQRAGYDTSKIYVEHPISEKDRLISEEYANSTPQDILDRMEKDLLNLKSKYMMSDSSQVQPLFTGMEDMISKLEVEPEVGLPLQGQIFNYVVSGALLGKFYLRSGSSGLGKTRSLMADACHFAFPLRYNWTHARWENVGCNEKVLIIITEQEIDEIQKMAMAYITGINESVIKRAQCTPEQKKIIAQAFKVFEHYADNFLVVRVPNPSISLIRQIVREQVNLHDIGYVFYDYVFISPSLLSEFRGMQLRNDEILLMFSDALKQLAVELNVFLMSSTQVNSNADSSSTIRNESSLAGSRAIINKADMGCIMARPNPDEVKAMDILIKNKGMPNLVTDIFKVRGGEFTQVRIWSQMDLGTLRKQDLFMTDAYLQVQDIPNEVYGYYEDTDGLEFATKLNKELGRGEKK